MGKPLDSNCSAVSEGAPQGFGAICVIANALAVIYSFLLNSQVIAVLSVDAPVLRDSFYIGFRIIPLLLVALAFPQVLNAKRLGLMSFASGVLAVSGCMFLACSHALADFRFTAVAFAMLSLGGVWSNLVPILMMCRLGGFRSVAACAVLSYFFGTLLSTAAGAMPLWFKVASVGAIPCIVLVLSRSVIKEFAALHAGFGDMHDLRLRNFNSFVSVLNPAFACLFVFHCVSGFALALNCVSGVPVHSWVTGFIVTAIALILLWRGKDYALADSIAGFAAFLVSGGLLSALVFVGHAPVAISNVALSAGSGLFLILELLILALMGARSFLGAIRVIALGKAFSSFGTLVGSGSGHLANTLALTDSLAASVSLAAILMVFMVLCYMWLRSWSFERLVASIEPPRPLEPIDAAADDLSLRCASVASEYGLTNREGEILEMLAAGMGGREIEEACVISYNTVKTHITHIYAKLGIHSQQELIDLVSDS